MSWPRAALLAGGPGLAVAVGWSQDIPTRDLVELVGLAFGVAGVAGITAHLALRSPWASSVRLQVVIVALASVGATALGTVAAAQAMFVSPHDLAALSVVLVAAATVGVLGAAETSRRLDEARRREQALERSRRDLVAWVSHDLRTPLAGIRAMVEALQDGVVDDAATVARYHDAIQRETGRLATLVDDLFELSRLQASRVDLHLEPGSLRDVVSDAVASALPLAGAKGVRLDGLELRHVPTMALATPEVGRVLRNLLDNAIRHTPSGGAVTVEVGRDNGHAYVTVADGCGGIAEEDLERVFDPAYRGDVARTPDDRGGGLGLAIARGLAEAHAGELGVQNGDGGCRFTVRLPLARSPG